MKRWMFGPVAQLWFCLAFACALFACESGGATAQAEAVSSAAPGKPGDCDLLKQRLCDYTGAEAPGCQAAELVIGIFSDSGCTASLKDFAQVKEKHEAWRAPCRELEQKVCEQVGDDSLSCKTVRDQAKSLVPKECEALARDPSTVIDSLKIQELAAKPLDAANLAKITAEGAPTFGPKDAKVTIVEFADFECPYCASAAEVTKRIKQEYGDRVRVMFRHFPLSSHPNAFLAAQASLAAQAQGKFWEYHDVLFENQGALDRKSLIEHAKKARLDVARFERDFENEALGNMVTAEQIMGLQVGVSSTPTMFINGARAKDAGHWETVKDMIDASLATTAAGG